MNRNRSSFLVVMLLMVVSGCIDLPDIEPGEPEMPDAGNPPPDAGSLPPDGGAPDGGPPDGGAQPCGDGILDRDEGEVCDDGNTNSGDGCSEDCRSDETCGNGIEDTATHEACDDGNRVTETECPYGVVGCTRCDATCSRELALEGAYCSDGVQNGTETCDDGNAITESDCPYGQATCTACNATCTSMLNLMGAYCSDGTRNGPEACDDGNTTTETACPYGVSTCTACNASCTGVLSLTGPYCGDGIMNGTEACDDGNTSSCGTCSAMCSQVQPAHAAFGSITIVSVANIADGETLTISDGVHAPVTFEFISSGDARPGNVRIFFSRSDGNAPAAATTNAAINGVGASLAITAQASSNIVNLVHDLSGSFGNQPITTSATSNQLLVSGMADGSGADCPAGTGCVQNVDCGPGMVCRADKTCGTP